MTTRIGTIQRIAGPLIEADGLLGVTMFEVCRVGQEELIGEVNRVVGDRAYIQVYEETTGLSPGEQVIATGTSLDVELGPGLVGSIFDGIQRPLPVIKEAVGDFITRGVTAPPLPQDKLWNFNPTLEKGAEVTGGDVLGTVQETSVFLHKILVPPRVHGKLVKIVPPGEYTIVDTIAQVETPTGKQDLRLAHRWPVRIGRPYTRKIGTEVPLYTGQRVIDTFFPVAKGGTGAIPGGFGTGKCVTGDTPIFIADGTTIPIQRLYEYYSKQDGIIEKDTEDETIIRLKQPIQIISFDGKTYVPKKATHIYRGKTNTIYQITTRTQRKVKVTPIHKLFRFNGEIIEEIPVNQLRVGDNLLVPRKLKIPGQIMEFCAYEIDPSLRVTDPDAIEKMIELLQDLKTQSTLKALAKQLDVSYDVLIGYWKQKNRPTLRFLEKLSKVAKVPRIPVKIVKGETSSAHLKIPEQVTKELAEWLGLFVADGHIKGYNKGIYLYNTDEEILNRFKELTEIIFDSPVEFGQDESDSCPYARISNAPLVKFLYSLGIPTTLKTKTIRIPDSIKTAPEEILIHFLAGYFTGDGSFNRYTIEFSSISQGLISDLAYLLTRFGILYRKRSKGESYVIDLHGKEVENLAALFSLHKVKETAKILSVFDYADQEISHFMGLDIIPVSQKLLVTLLEQGQAHQGQDIFRKKDNIRLRNYTELGETPSREMVGRIVDVIDSQEIQIDSALQEKLTNISKINETAYFDRITKIEAMEVDIPVYDLTVKETHNFVGGELPFTLHNTVTLHQLAKWADAEIIVYVGCGERGNEMTEVLEDFPKLKDPKSGKSLMERTLLVANTSNMPVAAREASIYTGITLAEYFRDQGVDVALMADSTSRWAEALREISGRLEEMPGEEGYPAYLGSRLAEFYERAGRVEVLGSSGALGSVTVTGAVSPAGGDFSEPVTQSTLRITKVFWALDKDMASRRFFPAINYLQSYSLYKDDLSSWYQGKLGEDWPELTEEALSILQRDKELREIVQLVGPDALPERERAILEAARMVKEDFLMQSALHPIDTYCPEAKSYWMLKLIMDFWQSMRKAIDSGVALRRIIALPVVGKIARMKVQPHENLKEMVNYFQAIQQEIQQEFQQLETGIEK